ncbi:FG-GAP-like repeat-containing protein [Streptomyces sp. NPDC086787]|uniref:FG-GAP-like repeat-containing protein n=1 Tax=Streptomyces sp. NPDC086787 TaxID=3365759 RepID=UPI00380C8C30
MSSRWRRLPWRRATAGTALAAVLASGLAVAGWYADEDPPAGAKPGARSATARGTEAEAIRAAASSGEAVEAMGLRTAYSSTWATPDGILHRRTHSSPVRARVHGQWKAIDTRLVRVEGGWSPRATNTGMVFSAGADGTRGERASRLGSVHRSLLATQVVTGRAAGGSGVQGNPLASLTVDGHELVLTWPYAIPEPIVDGSRALYPEILPGADLVLSADDDGFGQVLVVKNAQAAKDPRVASLAYGLSSPDLTFGLDERSRVVHARDGKATDVALSPTPLMWDSAGATARTDGGLEVSPAPGGTTVRPTGDDTEDAGDAGEPSAAPDSPTTTPKPTETAGEPGDPYHDVRPPATDEAADPTLAPPGQGLPSRSAPAEPSPPAPHTGAAATLDLPGLAGPQPDSHGTLVGIELGDGRLTLTPDQKLLTSDDTVYPVFIDPSIKKHTDDWTTAYNRHPDATFYNGKGFNSGTHEARVGFESDTWGTSRSLFAIDWDASLKGSKVYSATLTTLETYSWSCDGRVVEVWETGPISSGTNWSHQPSWKRKLDSKDVAHGWKASRCPDDYVGFDVKSLAQDAVDGGWSKVNIGMRAANENDQYAWKKFQADGGDDPYIDLDYNRPPKEPTGLDMDPELYCDTSEPYVQVGRSAVAFWASASDPDGNLSKIHFDLWPTGGSGNLIADPDIEVGNTHGTSARVHTAEVPASKFVNGKTYSWQARAIDKRGQSSTNAPKGDLPCRFVYDGARPTSPTVTSSVFPDADANHDGDQDDNGDSRWSSTRFGTAGSFTFKCADSDVVRYEYGFNGNYTFTKNRTMVGAKPAPCGWAFPDSVSVKPPQAGPNLLYVRAVDDAGNVSEPTKYFFYVTPNEKADAPGDMTGDRLPDLFVIDGNNDLRLYPSAGTTDLTKGTGDLHASMGGAYRENPEADPGDTTPEDEPAYLPVDTGDWSGALITHLGDVYRGDGLQDLIARREGRLWVYPGDGYGGVDVDRRQEILLPAGSPDPATYTQLVSAGDATGDGKPDLFVRVDGALWFFTGYNGSTFAGVTKLASTAWTDRDLVTAQDISGDGVTDLLYRSDTSGRLLLRLGKPAASGGVDISSLAAAVDSATGEDGIYGSGGWSRAAIRMIYGTPDANGDKIPDMWALTADGVVRFYPGGRTVHGTPVTVISGGWTAKKAFG